MQFPNARILIFAKAPVPGEVKTRLAPRLGIDEAATLYQRLLESKVRRMAYSGLCPVECWCTPSIHHAFFSGLNEAYPVSLFEQKGADLGARMAWAARRAVSLSLMPVLIGADSPPLDEKQVARALGWLAAGADAVLGPAEDGGYVLLGLRRYDDRLFDDIPWGTDRVLAMTRERCAGLGWSWRELPTLWDIDRPEDLRRLEAFDQES